MSLSLRDNLGERSTPSSSTATFQQGNPLRKEYEYDFRRLTSAAYFAAQLFTAEFIPFAFMGGYSLKLRGNKRDTCDVDIAFGGTMEQLIRCIVGQPR
jgi:hypothetical protein